MDQVRPVVIKFIYIAAITLIFFTFLLVPSLSILSSLVMSAVVTLVLFFVGDRFILTRFGALTSSIANFVLAALVFSLAGSFISRPLSAGAIFSAAAVIGVAEWFYYRYVQEAPIMAGESGGGDQSQEQGEHQEGQQGPEQPGDNPDGSQN